MTPAFLKPSEDVRQALGKGMRGLPGGSSLIKLREKYGL